MNAAEKRIAEYVQRSADGFRLEHDRYPSAAELQQCMVEVVPSWLFRNHVAIGVVAISTGIVLTAFDIHRSIGCGLTVGGGVWLGFMRNAKPIAVAEFLSDLSSDSVDVVVASVLQLDRSRVEATKPVEPTGYAALCDDRIDDGYEP